MMSEINMFSPLKLRNTTIPNRVIMGSMHTGLEEAKDSAKKQSTFYAERAKHGVGLIITGGVSPNFRGRLSPFGSQLSYGFQVKKHKTITDAVHKYPTKICMQILHAGRYGYHPFTVSASKTKAPISPYFASKLSLRGIRKTIKAYTKTALLAQKAGYDGVEIMGSEGYFINQFLSPSTNFRTDKYGGSFENRTRLALELVREIRKAVRKEFILIFRISLIDLVKNGMDFEEVKAFASLLEKENIDIFNTGIGWHEARVPTIATMVPRAAFSWVTAEFKKHISTPVIASNRINTAETIKEILTEKKADMVSMARPFLADPAFLTKVKNGQYEQINTCIACNQACLDHIFKGKLASCLVNPKACHEEEFSERVAKHKKKIAIVGAGPAGISAAIEAATRGHQVTLYEKNTHIGGQFNLAKVIPGKEEFFETIRYFKYELERLKVVVKTNTEVTALELKQADYEEVIISTGILPRKLNLPGIESQKVISYTDLITGKKVAGEKVAIIGAGGIGFDVAEFLLHQEVNDPAQRLQEFFSEWGIDYHLKTKGSVAVKKKPEIKRSVFLLQRKDTRIGKNLGKTTGWIHRQSLKHREVKLLNNLNYKEITEKGLIILQGEKETLLEVDSIIICAGQTSNDHLYHKLKNDLGIPVHLIGGAKLAEEIDAKRAIDEGVRLANRL